MPAATTADVAGYARALLSNQTNESFSFLSLSLKTQGDRDRQNLLSFSAHRSPADFATATKKYRYSVLTHVLSEEK